MYIYVYIFRNVAICLVLKIIYSISDDRKYGVLNGYASANMKEETEFYLRDIAEILRFSGLSAGVVLLTLILY